MKKKKRILLFEETKIIEEFTSRMQAFPYLVSVGDFSYNGVQVEDNVKVKWS